MRGIAAAKPGGGSAISAMHTELCRAQRFSVVRDFSGHGLGRIFHDAPNILHYGKAGTGPVLKPGMFFTVEPMVNAGTWQVKILSDGWTAVTRDKQLSAQFEHSVGITETGVEFFTLSPKELAKPPYDLAAAPPADQRQLRPPSDRLGQIDPDQSFDILAPAVAEATPRYRSPAGCSTGSGDRRPALRHRTRPPSRHPGTTTSTSHRRAR